jgi:hypothetical protein
MANIAEVIALWQALDVEAIAGESLRDSQDAIVTMQAEQMRLGKKSTGEKIGWYGSNAYAQFKQLHGSIAPFRVPDLLLTGAFYGGLKVNLSGDKLEITSTDEKTPMLVKKYGEEIFGLMDDSREMLQEEVFAPDMVKRIRQAVRL